jgi:outer membrane protein assembly factor BamB
MTRLTSFITSIVVCVAATVSFGADWPQYRFDAGRTAACPQSLPADLHCLWVRELPPPRPAFPGEIRLGYDATYEPVVMGKTMFVPSMVTDSVTALDTETGQERWRFFAEGPVRLAPVAWQDKVYFVSDDGHLYCVGAADGRLKWKFRGLPDAGKDRKLMGDGRLVSVFPARGGPVLADGTIYFAAGIWGDEGVFVHALNAETGQVVWSNTDSGRIAKANADHGVAGEAGISPQGHLAIVGDMLIVPCGAQLPALLDIKTGKLQTYTMGWGGRIGLPKGCAFVSGTGKYLMHAGDIYDMGQPDKDPSSKREYDVKRMIHVGALTRLQIEPANQKDLDDFREPVLTPEAMYYQQDKGIVACDLTKPTLKQRSETTVPDYRREDVYPDPASVVFAELWKLPCKSEVHIKAGGRLYAGRRGFVEAVDIPGRGLEPGVSWRAEISGTPHRMLAADGKLFVVTLEGRICAFGPDKPAQPVVHKSPAARAPAADPWTAKAAGMISAAGITDGYVLALGLADARLAEELVRQSRCDVIAVEADAAKAARFRERFERAGLYGSRISVLVGDPASYRFPAYLASLIVLGDPGAVAKAGDPAFLKALFRSLRPYGGTACLEISADARQALGRQVSAGEFPGGVIGRKGDLVLLSRQGRLADSADWSHAGANAANTGASQDRLVKAPLTRLWFDGAFRWHRRPEKAAVRVAGGRVLVNTDNKLYAVDVYTGRHLWQAVLPASDGEFVALEDAIYVTAGKSCVVLDPASGNESGQMTLPDEPDGNWSHIRVAGEIFVGAIGRHLVCIDRKTGRMLWDHQCENNVSSIALGGGKVFASCSDTVNRRRIAAPPNAPGGAVAAFDARGGKLLWKIDAAGEVLYSEPLDVLAIGRGVYRGKDGLLVWSGAPADQMFVVGDRLISYLKERPQVKPKRAVVVMRNLLTGEEAGSEVEWYQRGCTIPRAGSNLLTTRYMGNAACIDLATGRMTWISNVRAACSNNLFPADGVLNVPNLSGGCTCNYMPVSQGFLPSPDSR